MMRNNLNQESVKANAYAQFDQIQSICLQDNEPICSQDNEWKRNFYNKLGP